MGDGDGEWGGGRQRSLDASMAAWIRHGTDPTRVDLSSWPSSRAVLTDAAEVLCGAPQNTPLRNRSSWPAPPPPRWGKNVIVYGDEGLKKDHPVLERLAKEKQCKSLLYFKEG